jgi:hypothetical protein
MAKAGTRKAATIRCAPALIDEPHPHYDSLEPWLRLRAEMEELQRPGMPYIGPFIRRADRIIARRQRWTSRGEGAHTQGGEGGVRQELATGVGVARMPS